MIQYSQDCTVLDLGTCVCTLVTSLHSSLVHLSFCPSASPSSIAKTITFTDLMYSCFAARKEWCIIVLEISSSI